MTTLQNYFHRTEARTAKTLVELAAIVAESNRFGIDRLSANNRRLVKRLRSKLCPGFDCHCANTIFGERD